jgi:hypothetical protein
MSCIIYGPWASSIALYICNLYTINGLRIIFHIYQGISQTLTLALSFLPTSHPPPPPLHTHHHCGPHPLLQAATPSAAPIPQPLPPSPPPSPLAWSRRHGPGCRRPSRRYFSLSLSCLRETAWSRPTTPLLRPTLSPSPPPPPVSASTPLPSCGSGSQETAQAWASYDSATAYLSTESSTNISTQSALRLISTSSVSASRPISSRRDYHPLCMGCISHGPWTSCSPV